jgi:hypothetical protein
VRLTAVIESGLALVFLGRSLTRLYFQRALAEFGSSSAAVVRVTATEVIPAWVSFVLLSGWAIALVATLALVLS